MCRNLSSNHCKAAGAGGLRCARTVSVREERAAVYVREANALGRASAVGSARDSTMSCKYVRGAPRANASGCAFRVRANASELAIFNYFFSHRNAIIFLFLRIKKINNNCHN